MDTQTLRTAVVQQSAPRTGTVTLGTGDATVTVGVRAMTLARRNELVAQCMKTGDDGEQAIDLSKLGPIAVVECTVNPDNGERLFADADLDAVSAMDGGFLEPVMAEAFTLSGFSATAKAAAEKN